MLVAGIARGGRRGRRSRGGAGAGGAGPPAGALGVASASSGKLQASQLALPAGFGWPQSGQRTMSGIPSSAFATGRRPAPRHYKEPPNPATSARAVLDPDFG